LYNPIEILSTIFAGGVLRWNAARKNRMTIKPSPLGGKSGRMNVFELKPTNIAR
jgi:hypothetical protein